MLVLLVGVIYETHLLDALKRHDILAKYHENLFWRSGNIEVITNENLSGSNVGITDGLELLCVPLRLPRYDAYILFHGRFRTSITIKGIASTVLRGYNAGITNERNFLCT
jgi:hypothetical protein